MSLLVKKTDVTTLADYVALGEVCKLDGKDYYTVNVFGNGDCALNAFAIGLIDLIKRDQLELDAEKQARFMAELQSKETSLPTLRNSLERYKNIHPIHPVSASHLDRFIRFISSNNIRYTDLVNYVKSETSREEIVALHLGFAPALRELGYKCYQESLGNNACADGVLEDDKQDRNAGVSVGHEILMPLATSFFKINFLFYHTTDARLHKNETIEAAPKMAVTYTGNGRGGHFKCLLPVENQSGLVRDLRPPTQVARTQADEIFAENTTLTTRMRENVAQLSTKTALTKNELTELTAVAMQTGTNLLLLGEVGHELVADLEAQTREFARITEDLRVAVQAKVQTTEAALNSLGLSALEKAVINAAPATSEPEDRDEALARALQNAEILDFLNRHYDTFTRPDARVSTEPVIQPRRPSAS